MSTPNPVPKAILYSHHGSVWSSVVTLCFKEKGYGDDEWLEREVDLTKGENFSPSYLKINANGSVPTLVIPLAETTSPDTPSRYRSLRDTMAIATFLDQARTSHTTHTTSTLPAPALAPATIEGKTISDTLIALAHSPTVDPNFLLLAARDSTELARKAASAAGSFISARQQALEKYIQEAQADVDALAPGASSSSHSSSSSSKPTWSQSPPPPYGAQDDFVAGAGGDSARAKTRNVDLNSPAVNGVASGDSPTASFESKTLKFLKEKKEANTLLYDIYRGQAGKEKENAFFEGSAKAWGENVPEIMSKLEVGMKGPFALGDHVSLADLHIIAWLTRLVHIAGGGATPEGLLKIEEQTEGKKVGPKMKLFWEKWIERGSFKSVYAGQLH